jgi:predicted homoserine dehydrogenase-like protein
VQVGLIGAGKFGSMFLNQVPTMPGLEVSVIADLNPERARTACRTDARLVTGQSLGYPRGAESPI